MEIGYVGGAVTDCDSSRMPTVTERLLTQKKDLESRLADINLALEAFEKNPDLQKLFDLISKVRY